MVLSVKCRLQNMHMLLMKYTHILSANLQMWCFSLFMLLIYPSLSLHFGNYKFAFCDSYFYFVYLFIYITFQILHINVITRYLSFSISLTPLLYLQPCCCKWQYRILFYSWVILHCVCVCVYLYICMYITSS